jgi:hypothetical protein
MPGRRVGQLRLPDEVVSGEFGGETARQASQAGGLGQLKLPDEAVSRELGSETAGQASQAGGLGRPHCHQPAAHHLSSHHLGIKNFHNKYNKLHILKTT